MYVIRYFTWHGDDRIETAPFVTQDSASWYFVFDGNAMATTAQVLRGLSGSYQSATASIVPYHGDRHDNQLAKERG